MWLGNCLSWFILYLYSVWLFWFIPISRILTPVGSKILYLLAFWKSQSSHLYFEYFSDQHNAYKVLKWLCLQTDNFWITIYFNFFYFVCVIVIVLELLCMCTCKYFHVNMKVDPEIWTSFILIWKLTLKFEHLLE